MNKSGPIAAVLFLLSVTSNAGLAQAPTFRTETTLVQLPVRVLDDKGNFVKGLTASDIEVLEDGVPQAISDFALVDVSSSTPPSPLSVPSSGVLSTSDLEKIERQLQRGEHGRDDGVQRRDDHRHEQRPPEALDVDAGEDRGGHHQGDARGEPRDEEREQPQARALRLPAR